MKILRLSGMTCVSTLVMKSITGLTENDMKPVKPHATPRSRDPELGPLWVITIAMGAFFIIAGAVIMIG